MSWDSSIFGLITVPLAWDGAVELNAAALERLPDEDEYPYLCRSMFGATNQSHCYREQAIHFGTTMKALPEFWDKWLVKFEDLLRQMSWFSVTARLETEYFSNYDYWWIAMDFTPGQPVETWERGEGPWTYAEFKRLRDKEEREGRR